MQAKRFLSAIALTGAVLLAGATGASAATNAGGATSAAGASQSTLHLTITHDGITTEATRGVTLRCHPNGGSHPDAGRACRELSRAGGDFTKLGGRGPQVCTMEYDPYHVKATGTWRGKPVQYEATHSNRCALRAATGSVFAF